MPALGDPDETQKASGLTTGVTQAENPDGTRSWNPARPFGWDLPRSPAGKINAPARRWSRIKGRSAAKPAQAKPTASTNSTAVLSEPAATVSTEVTGQERLAIFATLLFLFLRFSFLHEFVMTHIGMNTYMLALAGALAYIPLLNAQPWRTASQTKLFWPWFIFAALIVLGLPFSFWPGGSW